MNLENLKLEKKPGSVLTLVFDIPGAETADFYKKTLKRYAANVSLSGFRKGKAPITMVEERYRPHVMEIASDEIVNEGVWAALEKEGIADDSLLTRPRIEKMTSFQPGESLHVETSFTVIPEFAVKAYKGLKLKEKKAEVTPEMIDAELATLAEQHASLATVERAAKDGDYIAIDFEGRDAKGEPLAGTKGQNVGLLLGAGRFLPDFEKALVGAKADEERTFDVTFPKDYSAEAMRGVTATFTAKVQAVKERRIPAIDDEFAKDLEQESLEALKEKIKGFLSGRLEAEAREELEAELLEKLREANPVVDLPQVMVDEEVQRRKEGFQRTLAQMRMKPEDFFKAAKKTPQDHENETLNLARDTVHSSLVLRAVAREEKMDVSAEELSYAISSVAVRNDASPQALAERLSKEGRLGLIKFDILKRKALQLILQNAEIEKSG